MKIIECVPNFSEGRNKEIVDSLAAALAGVSGVVLLDAEMDAAHNRSVISVAGDPEAVAGGVIAAVGKAAELIDLRHHKGEHPRIGATDVIPFVPIAEISMEECVEVSVQVARTIAERYGIPTYLYELSARIPERQDLSSIRKGQFEQLREEIRTAADRTPDFGPCEVHPSAGATAVGARFPLIAYNIYLQTQDISVAKEIARTIRFSSGGLRHVKALGFPVRDRNQVQVSINLTNYEETPIYRVFDLVCREAEGYGVSVASSEIVGLVPQKALDDSARHFLRLENFGRHQILENRLYQTLLRERGLDEFILSVANVDPLLPAGGSVAALAGSLGAALGEMMASLTEGRPKFAAVDARTRQIHAQLTEARELLKSLVREDALSYKSVVDAYRLPKETASEKLARTEAIQRGLRNATETPLSTARAASRVLEHLGSLIKFGNPNARCDVAVGAQLAYASIKGAFFNVRINTQWIEDRSFAENSLAEAAELERKARKIIEEVDLSMAGC
jgi:glutamate formiminotransferase / formiminotetrahydrofolate cyclodeaminase